MTFEKRGYGFTPDRPSHRKKSFRALAGSQTSYPEAYSLAAHRPPIFDQYRSGSCGPHAKIGALMTTASAAGSPLPFTPSPSVFYQITRALDRTPLPDGTLPPLEDSGSEPGQLEKAAREWGFAKMGPLVRDRDTGETLNTDVDPDKLAEGPDFLHLEESSHELNLGDYAIEATGSGLFSAVKLALSLDHAVCVGFWADRRFEEWKPGQAPVPAPNEADTSGGWHYTYLVGYELGRARLVNSWGEEWGDRGECWVSPAFVASCVGIYATALHEVRT